MPTMHELRVEGRVARLTEAAARISNKLESDSRHPNAKRWRAKLEEYRASLERIANGIPEHNTAEHPRVHHEKGWKKMFGLMMRNKPGVTIRVPVDELKIRN